MFVCAHHGVVLLYHSILQQACAALIEAPCITHSPHCTDIIHGSPIQTPILFVFVPPCVNQWDLWEGLPDSG